MNKKKKLTIITITLTGIIGWSGSSLAFTSSPFFELGDLLLGGTLSEITALFDEIKGYITAIANADGEAILDFLIGELQVNCSDETFLQEGCAVITPEGSTIADILADSTGAFGLPDPKIYQEKIDLELDSSTQLPTWGYYNNQTLASPLVKNAADRTMTEIVAGTLLSSSGQESIKERLELDAANSEAIVTNAQLASQANNTQDVLKYLTAIVAQQSIFAQETAKYGAQGRMDNQVSNLNLANISRTVDRQENERNVNNNLTSMESVSATLGISLF